MSNNFRTAHSSQCGCASQLEDQADKFVVSRFTSASKSPQTVIEHAKLSIKDGHATHEDTKGHGEWGWTSKGNITMMIEVHSCTGGGRITCHSNNPVKHTRFNLTVLKQ